MTPLQLRAWRLRRQGCSLRQIADWLGQRNIESTSQLLKRAREARILLLALAIELAE